MTEQQKDPMIRCKSPKRETNSKGCDWIHFYLDPESVVEMSEILIEQLSKSKRGLRVDIHFAKHTNKETGKEFDAATMFIKQKKDIPGMGQQYMKPKEVSEEAKAELEAKIEAFKKGNKK